jgi:parallel beta-helix repeat protein
MKRIVSGLMFMLLLMAVFSLSFKIKPTLSEPRTIIVPDDYPTIQEAINNANEGDTIFVRNGIYYENIVVNKTISVLGESRETTIIDGKGVGHVVQILANNTLLSNFTIQNGGYNKFDCGVFVFNSFNSSILNNAVINNNWEGLRLCQSTRCLLRNNIIANNSYWNFGVTGTSIEHFIHDIDASNTINGRAIYYLIDQHNLNISNLVNVGYLAIINSSNINVEGLVLRDNFYGLQCVHTTNSIIGNVSITRTHEAIYLKDCSNITVRDSNLNYNWHTSITSQSSPFCRIFNNSAIGNQNFGFVMGDSPNSSIYQNLVGYERYGIYLDSANNSIVGNTACRTWYAGIWILPSSYNSIIANNIVENNYYDGIRLSCDNCIIFGNNITNNYYGLSFSTVSGNRIFHNNFINNKGQTVWSVPTRVNTWDNGYPSGGNYWSDYRGVDLYSGPYQNVTGSDGIGDTPYVIDENNVDHYPLMKPWTPKPSVINATVDIQPQALNLRSKGKWITAYIELLEGYNVQDINVSTIMLNGTIPVDLDASVGIGDYDKDGVEDLTVKFNRTQVVEFMLSQGVRFGDVTLTLTGELYDGTPFEGKTIISVSSLYGDVNCNGKVNISDIVQAAASYLSKENEPNWNPNANFAPPYNSIDIFDLVTIAANYGKTYP